jgi:hypothetical protein
MLATDDADRAELDRVLHGFKVSRVLGVIADLGIADKIPTDGCVSVDDLAAGCAVQPEPLLRVLRMLAALKIFRVTTHGTVAHTPRSRLLRTDTPNSMHYAARFWTAPGLWNAWGRIDVAMRGEIPHEVAWNTSRFAYLREHPDEARVFDAMMESQPQNQHAAVAAAYDFSGARLIADIGGGNGAALRHILSRFPTPLGLVFDREDVIDAITPEQRLQGRISTQGGSFFDSVPSGADIYMLIWVLHDWPDEDCVRILRTCRTAMSPNSLLLVGELILEPDPTIGKPISYIRDIHMMAMFGRARERTEADFRVLFDQSEFSLRRIISTASPISIIEAAPTR